MRTAVIALVALASAPALAQEAAPNLETKWLRDSVEYYEVAHQTYRVATSSVAEQARKQKRNAKWAVVLDVDETVLDNSAYQLERAAYAAGFDWASWNAWCERRAAQLVPGAKGFIDAVRDAGGDVVFLTNRHVDTLEATRDNLAAEGVYEDGDLLCLLTDDDAYDKAARRAELRSGEGACAFADGPRTVLAYLGDTIHDFPEDAEEGADVLRHDQFGSRYFILPNPMYGAWAGQVTRPLP